MQKDLSEIKTALVSNQSDYCKTDEAARIIGLTNTRHLKKLFDMGYLPRYARGTDWVYKKTDCHKVAAMLDQGTIVL